MKEQQRILKMLRCRDSEIRTLACILLVSKGVAYTKKFLETFGTEQYLVQSSITKYGVKSIDSFLGIPLIIVESKRKKFAVISYGMTWMGTLKDIIKLNSNIIINI